MSRAQVGVARYFLALVVGAIMTFVVSEIGQPILEGTRDTTANQTALQGTQYLETGIEYLPLVYLIVSFFGIILLSIYQREVLR